MDLPDIHAKDVPLDWGPLEGPSDPFVYGLIASSGTDARGEARWTFYTATDRDRRRRAAQLHRLHAGDGPSAKGRCAAPEAVERALGQPAAAIGGFVEQIFSPFTKFLTKRIDALLDARGRGSATLVFHDQPKPTPMPSASPSPTHRSVPDPCSLIHDYEAEAASGVPVLPGIQQSSTVAGVPTLACIFKDADQTFGTAHVRLDIADLGAGAAATFRSYKKGSGLASGKVTGLGDDNFYASGPHGETLLFVREGSLELYLAVLVPRSLPAAKKLMKLILGRL